jgi:hypothetical protein
MICEMFPWCLHDIVTDGPSTMVPGILIESAMYQKVVVELSFDQRVLQEPVGWGDKQINKKKTTKDEMKGQLLMEKHYVGNKRSLQS